MRTRSYPKCSRKGDLRDRGKGIGFRRCGRGGNTPILIGVRDTLEAFQRLATHYRNRFPIPVIAITGSNKTTTKENGGMWSRSDGRRSNG